MRLGPLGFHGTVGVRMPRLVVRGRHLRVSVHMPGTLVRVGAGVRDRARVGLRTRVRL